MQTHIAKALQSRCKAIRNAVKVYNSAAEQLDPPHPPISWETVSHINFLEEFNLLHDTRQDIRDKQWSQPAVRELMKLSQRVKRAREEVERCHIAIRRLYTAIRDEDDFFARTLSRLQAGDPALHRMVHDFVTRRQQVNNLLLTKLASLVSSPDYTGDRSRGIRVGGHSKDAIGSGQLPGEDSGIGGDIYNDHDDGDDGEEFSVDETAGELASQLIDYLSDLSLQP